MFWGIVLYGKENIGTPLKNFNYSRKVMEKPNFLTDSEIARECIGISGVLREVHQIGLRTYFLVFGDGGSRRFEVGSEWPIQRYDPGTIWNVPLMGVWDVE